MSKIGIFAKSDPIFKMIFGDPENKTALIGLLREIIDIPEEEYAHIEIIDPNLRVNKSYGKSGILDIKLTTKSGQRINVEIQIRKASDLKQRILFYASKMVAEQLKEGQKYGKIRKVISIMICTDHNLIEDSKEYHNRYFLYDKNTDSIFTDLLEIDILEFKKVPKNDKSDLATWLRFLNTDDKEELDKMAVRGECKTKINIAKNLLKSGLDSELLVSNIGLSKEEIEKLRWIIFFYFTQKSKVWVYLVFSVLIDIFLFNNYY